MLCVVGLHMLIIVVIHVVIHVLIHVRCMAISNEQWIRMSRVNFCWLWSCWLSVQIYLYFLVTCFRAVFMCVSKMHSATSPSSLHLPFSVGLSPYLESLPLDVAVRLSSLSKTPVCCCCFCCCCCCNRPRWISHAMRTWAAHHRPRFYRQQTSCTRQKLLRLVCLERWIYVHMTDLHRNVTGNSHRDKSYM